MASTYSTSLRLELMATGDQTGTWGDTTNTNLGTLLEQSITGVLSKAMADADQTLTELDGASDESRNAVVEVTGALTGAKNVIVPTAEKLYLAKNSTSGGYAVTFKTTAGSGVAVAAGTAQWVYCDGTNVVQGLSGTLAAQAAASVAITGGSIAGLTTLTMASGAATPATNDAAALGTTSLMWSDLFLASGAAVNFNNGNVVLTHSSGILTVGTGDLRVTTAGTDAASVVTVGGTQTLTNKTLPAATTSSSGVVELATAAEYRTGTDTGRALVVDQVWDSADCTALTDGATIAVDFATGYNFGGTSNAVLSLGGDRTLGAPSNVSKNQSGVLWFGAASSTRVLTLNAAWNLCDGAEAGPYSITTAQALGVVYVVRGSTTYVTAILRTG